MSVDRWSLESCGIRESLSLPINSYKFCYECEEFGRFQWLRDDGVGSLYRKTSYTLFCQCRRATVYTRSRIFRNASILLIPRLLSSVIVLVRSRSALSPPSLSEAVLIRLCYVQAFKSFLDFYSRSCSPDILTCSLSIIEWDTQPILVSSPE